MITEQTILDIKKVNKTVQCELCHCDAKTKPSIKRLGVNFVVICKTCIEQFSEQEMELMVNMFTAFGGYFNQYRTSKEIQQQIIKEVAEEYSRKEQSRAKLESDVRTLHKAFLNGISLPQLINVIS
jgi:pyruvate/2-oxoacid:ferredoxin oxidoreductase beta subunit